jgi:ubiquinol-cytochrome c reductase iron-sulfur subunit
MLGVLLGSGLGVFGIVALFPLVRSLGPLPHGTLRTTNWRRGSLLVDAGGRAIQSDTLDVGGIVTVFPAGFENDAATQSVDQVVLIRAQTTNLVTEKGRGTWAPEGYVAYSKVCTHAGCPVGLYERELHLLVCPCHQSMFNIDHGAVPQFGPAARPLPQLAIYIDGSGFLRAQGPFDQPIGPGYWER